MIGPEDFGLVARSTARWPQEPPHQDLRQVAGFAGSRMAPLVVRVAELCLTRGLSEPESEPVSPAVQERRLNTGILLVTGRGDIENGVSVARAVDRRERVSPLAFFQSVPNSVLGHLTQRWGLGGPVLCTSPAADGREEALRVSAELIESGEAAEMLAICAEQACAQGEDDIAQAFLLAPAARGPDGTGDR